jgi:tetratricopeptide (TPR) repeat protein
MTIDTYAVCPCGSGKKIRFCKCKDSVGELDRVIKMVEGGQVVPALDRLSKILVEHPDAAWALAIRGQLLMDLREYQSLGENAERFARLQPSNPIALTQRAASELYRGDLDAACASFLEALAECGREINSFVVEFAAILGAAFAGNSNLLSARVYLSLAMIAEEVQSSQYAIQILRQISDSPSVNHLLKSNPEEAPRPVDVPWGERFDEAAGLLHGQKVILAQSKFESLRRQAPNEPSILLGLLMCAIWGGDAKAQSDVLLKLSACPSLPQSERVRYRALSSLVHPDRTELTIPTTQWTAEISDVEMVETALAASRRFLALPREMIDEIRAEEGEVRPRAVYQVLAMDAPDVEPVPTVEQMPEVLCQLFVFGRQTDRAPFVNVVDCFASNVDAVKQLLNATLGSVNFVESEGESAYFFTVAEPWVPLLRIKASMDQVQSLQFESQRARIPEYVTSLKLGLLGGRSLVETRDDAGLHLERSAMLLIIEACELISKYGADVTNKIRELAGFPSQTPITLTDDAIESLPIENLLRVDPTGLSLDSVVFILRRAEQIRAMRVVERLAKYILDSGMADDRPEVKLLSYISLVYSTPRLSQSLEIIEQAKSFATNHGYSTAELLLNEVEIRLSIQDLPGFQRCVQELMRKYGKDPAVMANLEHKLRQVGLSLRGPANATASAARADATSSPSGIWTPESSAATPAAASGSKLWIPGMD